MMNACTLTNTAGCSVTFTPLDASHVRVVRWTGYREHVDVLSTEKARAFYSQCVIYDGYRRVS